jgi:hypothetical protein
MAAGDVITIVEDNIARKGNYFDRTDDYVLHDAHAVARVAANDTTGTYSAWIYKNEITIDSDEVILSAGDNDSANEYLEFYTYKGALFIKLQQGGATQFLVRSAAGIVAVPARTWTHVAVVQDGVQPALYVNGVAVSTTNTTATDLTMWYDELANCDKFAIGVLESNNTHTADFNGAIGQVKYWNRALSAAEILRDYNGEALYDDATYLQFNVTMEDDGTTDSGLGADNGTLTGNAHYGGLISAHSIALEKNCTGHAAERSTTWQVSPSKLCTVIVRGD